MPTQVVDYDDANAGHSAGSYEVDNDGSEFYATGAEQGDFTSLYPMESLQEPTVRKTRKVKVGKRVFEVEEAVDSYSPGTSVLAQGVKEIKVKIPPNIAVQAESYQTATNTAMSSYVVRENTKPQNETMVAMNQPRRRRKRNHRSNSICSVPVSTISAFSAFSRSSRRTVIPPKRSKCQMFMNSAIMFGREFCYAVEAGLTTPILLSIGLPSNLYSLVWVISPILGFVLQPIVGNLSDRCKCRWGRRRPFILALSILLILGMTLFLNGEQIVSHFDTNINGRRTADPRSMIIAAITVTIVGVVLFDFSADFIEGPIRAYAMDVCDEEDTKINLFYQAVFTGAGGAFGYASGGVAWTSGTPLGLWFPTDRQVIYTAAAVVFITTCVLNLTSIPESNPMKKQPTKRKLKNKNNDDFSPGNSPGFRKKTEGQQLLDANRNYVDHDKQTSLMKPVSVEDILLYNIMRQNRNKLFNDFEASSQDNNLGFVTEKDFSKLLKIVNTGGLAKYSRKYRKRSASKNSNKSSRKRGVARKVNRAESGHSYGTFLDGGNMGLDYPHYQSSSNLKSTNQPPSLPPRYQTPSNMNQLSQSQYNQVLEARSVFPTAPTLSEFNKTSYPSTSYSTESESDTTCTSLTNDDMNNVKLSPYAEVDPMQSKLLELRSKASSKKKLSANHLDLIEIGESVSDNELIQDSKAENSESGGLKSLMRSIASMPKDLRNLCVCHLFGWVAFLCMALFFTDFVGQVVMQGDPRSPTNSRLGTLYRRGVEVGNWGLTINAAVSSIYCFLMKPLMRKIGPRSLYIFGYLTFSVGCLVVALVPSVYIVLCLSSIIGIMSATLYTVPYLLVAQYHENYKHWKGTPQERGIGTDCALVTCMIQLAQIITGLGIGALVNLTGTVTVTVITASIVALLGTLWAAFCVKY